MWRRAGRWTASSCYGPAQVEAWLSPGLEAETVDSGLVKMYWDRWLPWRDKKTRELRREAAIVMGLKLLDVGEEELRVRVENVEPKWSTHRCRGE